MTSIKRISLLAGAATLTLTGGSFADTSVEARNDELRSRIAQLEGRLANVEAQKSDNWLTERRADEIRSVVEDVLADADTRSSMLAQGMTAGYDDGAVISSADGNWLLRTNLLLQTRFMFNNQDSNPNGESDSTRWGFEVTRAKFSLTGNVVSPDWFYRIDIETSSNAGVIGDERTGVLDAYAGYDFGNGWKMYGGQFKAPLLFEELVEDQYQQAVERSLVNYLYTGGYTQGIAVDYLGDQWHVVGSWNNGINDIAYGGGVGVGSGSSALDSDTELAFTVRGEWLAMGTWDQFKDITSPQGEEMGVRVGAAAHVQTSESGGALPAAAALQRTELVVLAADVSVEFGGSNVYAQLSYSIENYIAPNAGPAGGGVTAKPWGIVLGGGWYWAEDWEVFGRYEWSDRGALGSAGNSDNINIITVGVNKYFAGHNAKWTTDIGIGLTTVDAGAGTPTGTSLAPVTGWRQDNSNGDGQVLIRTQLQILF